MAIADREASKTAQPRVTRRRSASGAARTVKVTVTIPEDVLAAAQEQVAAGRAPSLSAYVSDALAERVKTERGDSMQVLLDEWDTEFGPPSEEDYAWARGVLDRFAAASDRSSSTPAP
jgi:Arc/MetJ-type ribon-helix-helix transcriptional regulator